MSHENWTVHRIRVLSVLVSGVLARSNSRRTLPLEGIEVVGLVYFFKVKTFLILAIATIKILYLSF